MARSWHDHVAAVDKRPLLLKGKLFDPPLHPVERNAASHKVGRLCRQPTETSSGGMTSGASSSCDPSAGW